MQTKTYLVTNNGEGSICVTGRTRIDIPGLCRDLKLVLPENTARQTVSRLKQRYPLLKITEVKGAAFSQAPAKAAAEAPDKEQKPEEAATDKGGKKQQTAPNQQNR